MRFIVMFVTLLLCSPAFNSREAAAGGLPRHGTLGTSVVEKNGVISIRAIVPNSAAQSAGLQPGDSILGVDGASVHNIPDFLARVRRPAGRSIRLRISHNNNISEKTLMLKRVADERDPFVDTIYSAASVNGTLRRTLVSFERSSKGKHPGILFVGGIGCFSVDTAALPFDPYRSLAHDLSRHGFVTMRLEKSGIGDSQGPPCPTVDFTAESHSYDAALAALKADPMVDKDRVYVFGHSIGSLIAPRLAVEHKLAGVIVAEGVGITWIEYELANLRRQLVLSGDTPSQIWTEMQTKELCMHRLLIEEEDSQKLLRERRDCTQYIVYPAPAKYMQEVAHVNSADLWMKTKIPVFAIYGSSDFVTAESDHRYIVSIVNAARPGSGSLDILKGMDHYLAIAKSTQESFALTNAGAPRTYDPALSDALLKWLCARERCA